MVTNAIARRLSAIEEKASMRSSDIANVLNVRPETVSRWNQGKAFPHPSTEKQILELDFIVDQLSDFYTPDEARLWLFSRQKLLNGRVPAEIIQSGNIDDVLGAVNQMREGVFL
jgi:transcriptional regulator with XRE-family HTH domain